MFFIPLDNQLHFLLLTLLPTYLVFTALAWERTDSPKRLFGLLFMSPLLLSVFSFLNAPVRREQAEYLLFAAGITMALMMGYAEFAARNPVASRMGILMAMALPVLFLTSDGWLPLPLLNRFAPWLLLAAGLLEGLLLAAAIAGRHKLEIQRLSGNLLATFGVLLFHLPWGVPAALTSHLFLLIGLVLCAYALYRGTFQNLRTQLESHETTLRRLDANLQTEVIRRVASIEKSNRVLLEKSRTDTLTGLFGRAAITAHADSLIHKQANEPMSVIMLDIDHFKDINDKLGHPVGDQCLKSLAGIARASFRANDVLGRYGGDEFIFLLPGTSPRMALTVADRFRSNIEVGSHPKFTVSVGIATFPQDGSHIKALVNAADQALYISKENGRNRVTHFSEREMI